MKSLPAYLIALIVLLGAVVYAQHRVIWSNVRVYDELKEKELEELEELEDLREEVKILKRHKDVIDVLRAQKDPRVIHAIAVACQACVLAEKIESENGIER